MLEKINVFLNIENNQYKVGEIVYNNRQILFQYNKDFLNTNINISPLTLPFNDKIYSNKGNLPGVFRDSLPDGWGRFLINRYFMKQDIKNVNELDYLSFTGINGFGALEYKPCETYLNDRLTNINLDKLANDSINILNNTDYFVDELLKLNGSSGGARPKITVRLNNKHNITNIGDKYIIKFKGTFDENNIGLHEYIYSLIAKKSNIEMTETILLPSKNCSGYFATKRFDRNNKGKLHLHSVAGLLNIDFRTDFIDYVDILKLTKILTKDFNEVLKMFRLMCFNVLIQNKDDHTKNFSFLLNSKNQWTLSPAYDLTKSNEINGEHTTTVNGKGIEISDNDLITVGEMFNIKKEISKDIIALIRENLNNFDKLVKEYK